MQNSPGGQRQPSSPGSSGKSGGMSPIMVALLGLLAQKAMKGISGQPAAPGGTAMPRSVPAGGTASLPSGGGLSDILGGLLGGKPGSAPAINAPGGARSGGSGGLGDLFGGAAAGSVLSGSLANIIKGLQDSGHGQAAQSWVGTGPNKDIAPNDLAAALGSETIDTLSQQTGVGRQELLAGLSQHLPDLVDRLTPAGRLPTEEEASQLV
jgi:uncharacterized protein YidB (DUF937 family)